MLRTNIPRVRALSRITTWNFISPICSRNRIYGLASASASARPYTLSQRAFSTTKWTQNSSRTDKIVSQITEAAEEQAKRGEGFDINVNDPAKVIDSLTEDELSEFVVDPKRVEAIFEHAKQHWRRWRKLPQGWSSHWEHWELLHTFYYPTPQFFLLLPQIDVIVNVRYAIPGEARPLMYNNEREAFFFEVVERSQRGSVEEEGRGGSMPVREKPRTIYYMDWQEEELYKVENAWTVKEVTSKMLAVAAGRSLEGLELKRLEPDVEGEKAIERLVDEDETVVPELVEKYLGYTPAPNDELLQKFLEESSQVIGEDDAEEDGQEEEGAIDPELEKESTEAYGAIIDMLAEDMDDPGFLEEAEELLAGMKTSTPEEMKPLRDLLVLLKNTDPSEFEDLKDTFAEQIMTLEREIEEDGKELGELLIKAKRAKKP